MSKAAKQRMCPAVGRWISAAECGENRGSRYACPGDCPHNPFGSANYNATLQIEDAVNTKSLDWLRDHALHPGLLEVAMRRVLGNSTPEVVYLVNGLITWALFFERDAAGSNCAERWERAGFPGLKNDERVMLRGRMQIRVALLEVRRVLDGERTEVVDVLAPGGEPVVVADRALASTAARFASLFAWVHPLPHFWRLSGTATPVEEIGPIEPVAVVTELVRHLKGPTEEPAMRVWLAQNFERFNQALRATVLARQQQMFASIDAHFGKVYYELQAPFDECRAALDAVPEVTREDPTTREIGEGMREVRVWFSEDAPPLALPAGSRHVLGRVVLGPNEWRIEAMTAERTATLRERFEARLGARVRFLREARDDLGSHLAPKAAAYDPALVPARLLEHPQRIVLTSTRVPEPATAGSLEDRSTALRRLNYQEFPDRPIPALDGRTPRDAARDPALRPQVARLLKTLIRTHDQENLRTGRQDDINWLPRELGLDELVLDPPPPRPRLRVTDETSEVERRETHVRPSAVARPPAPPPPAEPWTVEQAAERLRNAMEPFQTAAEGYAELEASGSTLIEDLDVLTADLLNDDEFSILTVFLLQAWFALVPPGTRAPELSFEALRRGLDERFQRLAANLDGPHSDPLKAMLLDCRQPALASLLMVQALKPASRFSKQVREQSQAMIAVVLVVVVDELERALRATAGAPG